MIAEKLAKDNITYEEAFRNLLLIMVMETGRDVDTILDNLINSITFAKEMVE